MDPKVTIDQDTNNKWYVVRGFYFPSEDLAKKLITLLGEVFGREYGEAYRPYQNSNGLMFEVTVCYSDAHGSYPSLGHIQGCLRTAYFVHTGTRAPWTED